MNVEIQESWYSLKECAENPKKLYIFGDNTIRVGMGGQAMIRPAKNSIGIATKMLPSNAKDAFFSDTTEQAWILAGDIADMFQAFEDGGYDILVLPADGLGTGLSQMPEKSPELFKWLNQSLSNLLGIEYHLQD